MQSGTWRDVTYAWRRHRRDPALAAVVAATLGLAIGLNASAFALYAAVALRPWAVPAAGRMVNVYTSPPGQPRGATAIGASLAQVRAMDTNATMLEGVAANRDLSLRFGDPDGGPGSPAQAVTGNYFRVLGVGMARGRGFMTEEDVSSAPQAVVVLAYRTWQRGFGADEAIVGKRVRLDDVPFTVVGVAPEGFGGTSDRHAAAWVPFASLRLLRPLDSSVPDLLDSPSWCCSSVFGRLRAGITPGQASAQLEAIAATFSREHGLEVSGIALTDTAMLSHPGSWQRAGLVFGLLQTAMLIVLMLACANVGNLLLARAVDRQHEIGTRLSLGATRARLVRQLLMECFLPAAAGGALGLALAHVLPPWLMAQMVDTPLNVRLTPGLTGAGFTLVVTLASVFAFGLAPALHATRADLTPTLRSRAWGPQLRLRSTLLTVQVAACVVILVCAALMMRGIQAVSRIDPGFRVQGLDVLHFDVPASAYGDAQVGALVQTLRSWQEAAGAPSALSRTPPLADSRYSTSMRREDEPDAAARSTDVQKVDAHYLSLLGIPLVAGRAFTPADGDDVVLVNEAFARRWLGEGAAVGATLIMGGKTVRRVIGVVRDAHLQQLDAIQPIVFETLSVRDVPRLLLPSTPGLAASVTAAVQRLDPRIGVRRTSLAAMREASLSSARFAGRIAGALGLVALALAVIGLSGMCGYLVRQRTRELGLRLALGASRTHLLAIVFGTTAKPTMWGLGVGAIIALAAARVIVSAVPGVRLGDLVAYAGAAAALGIGGVAATCVPARRALRIEPAQALRRE